MTNPTERNDKLQKVHESTPGTRDLQSTAMTGSNSMDDGQDYIARVLDAYRTTPGTCGKIRRADRVQAQEFHLRGVPLRTVENALALAAARRMFRASNGPPLNTVRSLAYFVPVIEEVLDTADTVNDNYYEYLRSKLKQPGKP